MKVTALSYTKAREHLTSLSKNTLRSHERRVFAYYLCYDLHSGSLWHPLPIVPLIVFPSCYNDPRKYFKDAFDISLGMAI